jgi:hypothetical protein
MIIYFRRGCVFANRQNVLIILLRLTRSILTTEASVVTLSLIFVV